MDQYVYEGLLKRFVRESNLIEFIDRQPRKKEVHAHAELLMVPLGQLDTTALLKFIAYIDPTILLRDQPKMNVYVGSYTPPPGGPLIPELLKTLLARMNNPKANNPYHCHVEYEKLHPFMDGNGRSGRALWLWQMFQMNAGPSVLRTSFGREWYIQSLRRGL